MISIHRIIPITFTCIITTTMKIVGLTDKHKPYNLSLYSSISSSTIKQQVSSQTLQT
ncbi:hypothetical protein HanRHA438_Chr05g0227181 [Helianthus annuus]|nr:hypothetical protein HanRHA438_Chr05g0227181 [Helianthus annuus]